jgi:hypothetical protein
LKSKTKSVLGRSSPAIEWERDFFDRHVRPDEDRISIFLYLFLNPYRAGLCPREDRWPWYWCCEEDWKWFKDHLDDELPAPGWLM